MTEESIIYYYMRDGEELSTVSLDFAIARRDPDTVIYTGKGKNRKVWRLD